MVTSAVPHARDSYGSGSSGQVGRQICSHRRYVVADPDGPNWYTAVLQHKGCDIPPGMLKAIEDDLTSRPRERMAEMITYAATVTLDGDDWLATCEQDSTIHTFASTLAGLRREVADAIRSSTDLLDGTVIPVHLVAGEGVSKEVARAIEVGNRRWCARPAQGHQRRPGRLRRCSRHHPPAPSCARRWRPTCGARCLRQR